MADLVVVGSYNAGLTVYSDQLPQPGETVVGHQFCQGPGGKGANQAIGARRLDADALFITKLGADAFGQEARTLLAAEGLPAVGIMTGSMPTGVALILVDAAGQNEISVAPGANLELAAADVLSQFPAHLAGCRIVLLQLECTAELAVGVAAWAHAAGKCVILNPAPARPLPPDALASFDVITPNEVELRTMAASLGIDDGPPDALARSLLDFGVRNVIVTLGEGGAVWVCASGVEHFESYKVQAVDTTGAGDAFTSALAAALARGEPMNSAIDQGCRAGAFCVTRRGVIDGLGRPPELAKLSGHVKAAPDLTP
jgi:ribokinase